MTVQRLAARHNRELSRRKFNGMYTEIHSDAGDAIVVMPQTFYNRSGECVTAILGYYKVSAERLIVIVGIMTTTSCAAELGVFARLASWIEPRTRGPVRHAFRMVYAIAAVTAAVLSNDAAILLVTPVVIGG